MRFTKFALLSAGFVLLASLTMYALEGSWEIFSWVLVAFIWWADDYSTREMNKLLKETMEEGTEKMKKAIEVNREIIKALEEREENEE